MEEAQVRVSTSSRALSRISYFIASAGIVFFILGLLGGFVFFPGLFTPFYWGQAHPVIYASLVILFFVIGYIFEKIEETPHEATQAKRQSPITLIFLGIILFIYFGPLTYSSIKGGVGFSAAGLIWLILAIGSISLLVYGIFLKRKQ